MHEQEEMRPPSTVFLILGLFPVAASFRLRGFGNLFGFGTTSGTKLSWVGPGLAGGPPGCICRCAYRDRQVSQ
jgi:hypothetical protein